MKQPHMTQALFVAWRTRDPENPAWGPVGRLEFDGKFYRYFYTHGARSLPGFEPFPQMGNLDEVYESTELFPLFVNRLLSKKRPEYEAYLRWGGFSHDTPPDPLAILAVTEGQRQTDAIEVFPCPLPDGDYCYLNHFFLHGIRWAEEAGREYVDQLQERELLQFIPEPSNPVDRLALAIYPLGGGPRLGYAPRYLAHDIHTLQRQCGSDFVDLSVKRFNEDAPLQQRVLCRMQACWPAGFKPCNTEAFQPIPIGVSANCGE